MGFFYQKKLWQKRLGLNGYLWPYKQFAAKEFLAMRLGVKWSDRGVVAAQEPEPSLIKRRKPEEPQWLPC